MESKTILINSEDRNSGTSSDFTYEIPNNGDFTHCCILGCNIPVSYYLIQAPYNTFTLTELSSSIVITVPIGNYNVNSFQTVLTVLLNTNSPNNWIYSMVFNNDFLLQATGMYTFKVTGNSGQQPRFVFPVNSEIHTQMGFNGKSTVIFSGNSLTSTNVLSFIPETVLSIQSDLCEDSNLLTIFHNNSIPYANISFQCQTDLYSKRLRSNAKDSLYNFNLLDQNGRNINLNGLPLLMNILLYKKDEQYKTDIQNYIKYKVSK